MKIELVQLAGRDGDIAYNLSRTLNAIATCAGDTDLLVFPETHLSGFVGGAQLAFPSRDEQWAARGGHGSDPGQLQARRSLKSR